MSTEALVGGYFNSIIFLGEFLGPVIGGQLMDKLNNIPEAVGIFTIICFVVVSYFILSDFFTHLLLYFQTIAATIGYIILYFVRKYSKDKDFYQKIEEEITASMASQFEKSGAFGPRGYSLSISVNAPSVQYRIKEPF